MLTREEQADIWRKTQTLLTLHRSIHTRLERSEISHANAKEALQEGEDDFKDFLKEVG